MFKLLIKTYFLKISNVYVHDWKHGDPYRNSSNLMRG